MWTSARSFRIWLSTMAAFLFVASAAPAASTHVDDFSANTLDQYGASILFNSGSAGNTVGLTWDESGQRAQVSLQGGYATSVMTTNVGSLVTANQDFSFSVDVSVMQEYVASIYLGDLGPASSSTYLRFNFDTFSGTDIGLYGYVGGTLVENPISAPFGSATSGTLEVLRAGSDLSFLLNGGLLFETSNSAFSNQALYYGVANQITSGSSGLTSLDTFDNWNFQVIPEPSTGLLMSMGLVAMSATRRCMRGRVA